ncbi:MAG TPA: nucleoside monophosphate kinase [Verrucomicrobiae bacterium]|nr:nucleoside monophosphate kinase [Verrucomicrobiae bacterium]
MQKYKAFILYGAPGCGKGTQGRALGALPGYYYCGCGEVFRAMCSAGALGKTVTEYSSRGELVPDSITIELWKKYIDNCVENGLFVPEKDILILDGIPRNRTQAMMLQETICVRAFFNMYFKDHTELVVRIGRRARREKRPDDMNEEVIRNRLNIFEQTSKQLLDFYGPELVCVVNSQNRPTEVLHDILEHMRRLL